MIEKAIKRLGYTTDWLDLGIINEESLLAQLAKLNQSDEKNTEHYRQKTFNSFIDKQSQLTDVQLDNILQLTDNGPDKADLHVQRIIALIYSGILTNQQFEKLSQYKEVLDNPIQRLYFRTKLIRKIKQTGLNGLFGQVQESKDVSIHEFVLKRKDINERQLRWMQDYACNQKLRDQAQQLFVKLTSQ